MTFGNLAALVQDNVKRILAYSGVVHAGYLLIPLVALEWNNPLVKSSFLFYLLVYTLANLGAFLVIAAIDERGELRSFRGLSKESPFLAAAMTVFLLSLGGFPPLAGFFGKLYLFSAAVSNGQIVLAIIGVVNSVISFGYYLKVVREMYLEEGEAEIAFPSPWLYGALYFLLFVILFIPLYQTDLLILSGLF
jgi:NADH-quinone oxidoreductase subunit N